LVAFVGLSFTYSVVTPVFEAPDEIQHFFYVVNLAEGKGLPVQPPAGPGGLWAQEGSQPPLYYVLAARLVAPLDTSDASALLWENAHANLGDPLNPANKNRIVHTDLEAWPYRESVLAIHLVRWLSVLMGAATVWLVYRIAGKLFPRQPALALATAAVTAFTPQFVFISGVVSNDNAIILSSTLAAWLLIDLLRQPHGSRYHLRLFLLGVVLGFAALSKLSGALLWPLAGVALLVAGWRARSLRRTAGDLAMVFGPALAVAGWWYLRNWQLYGDPTGLTAMLSIVGDRTQPLGWRGLLRQFEGLRISYWALFGWFNLILPNWVYRVLDALATVAFAGLVWGAVRRWHRKMPSGWRRLVLPVAWISVVFIGLVRWTLLTPATQGRLLFPAAWAFSLLLMLGWSQWVPSRWRAHWLAAPIVPLAVLALVAPFAVIRPAYQRPPLVTEAAIPDAARLTPVDYGTTVRRLGAAIEPDGVHPGDLLWVTVYWQVLDRMDQDYTVYVHLLDHQGQSVAEANNWPGLGNYPTRLWQPGMIIADRYPVRIPADVRTPELVTADIGLFTWPAGKDQPIHLPDGTSAVGLIGTVRLLPRQPDAVQPPAKLEAHFGADIKLLGYERSPASLITPGSQVTLTLYWLPSARPMEDYTVFVHLRDSTGNKIAQGDNQPLDGSWPTSAWEPGQPVIDHYQLTVPQRTAPGAYDLWIGMYRSPDGSRLAVSGPTDRVHDGGILVDKVFVKQP